eukprot:gene27456-34174_t
MKNYLWRITSGSHKNVVLVVQNSTGSPHTRAEFAFDPKGGDYYDISLEHGTNVPMSMTPIGGDPPTATNPLYCGAAGSVTGTSILPKCTYGFDPMVNSKDYSSDILYVAAPDLKTIVPCTGDNQCSQGLTCGLSAGRDPTGLQTNDIPKVCGKVVDIWSANEVCTFNSQYSDAPYACNTQVPHGHGTYTDLYGCGLQYDHSGSQPFSKDPVTDDFVCGCDQRTDFPSSITKCEKVNPSWKSIALPLVNVFKNMCPTGYTYAYDDVTSLFSCNGETLTGYDIEFCPGGIELHSIKDVIKAKKTLKAVGKTIRHEL